METGSTTKSSFYQPIISLIQNPTSIEQDNIPQIIDEKPLVNFLDIFDNIKAVNHLNSSISYIDERVINTSSSNISNMSEELKTSEFWNKRRYGITLPELLKEYEPKASL